MKFVLLTKFFHRREEHNSKWVLHSIKSFFLIKFWCSIAAVIIDCYKNWFIWRIISIIVVQFKVTLVFWFSFQFIVWAISFIFDYFNCLFDDWIVSFEVNLFLWWDFKSSTSFSLITSHNGDLFNLVCLITISVIIVIFEGLNSFLFEIL